MTTCTLQKAYIHIANLYRADYKASQMSDRLNSLSNMHQVNQLTTPLASKIHYGGIVSPT